MIFGLSDLMSLRSDARNARSRRKISHTRQSKFGDHVSRDARLKQDSINVLARPCRTVLAPVDRLSSRPRSSIFFPFCVFWRFTRSMIVPASLFKACCRWRTSGCEDEDDEAAAGGAGSPASASFVGLGGAALFLGFNLTEMVVPKRECREGAWRAKSRRRLSSMERRLCKFLVTC